MACANDTRSKDATGKLLARDARSGEGCKRIARTECAATATCIALPGRLFAMQGKKKCDECRPRCSDCRRLNLGCHWLVGATTVEGDRPETSDACSPSCLPTLSAEIVPNNDPEPEGDLSTPRPITPFDAEDFIATLFPHPLPRTSAVTPPLSQLSISINPYLRTDEERSLFNHYIHVVSRALCRSGDKENNPFLVTLLPLAAVSDTVTSVILSLSGCHWKRVYPTIWGTALTRQGQGRLFTREMPCTIGFHLPLSELTCWRFEVTADNFIALAQVNDLLGCSDKQSIFASCATVLLLCLTELFDGTSRVWKWHLKAASAILKSAAFQSLISTDEWKFCISLFHYLDSMSTISRCKAPLLQSDDSVIELCRSVRQSSVPELCHSDSADAIYGISPALFDLLGMVNLLANQRIRRVDELSEIGFRAAAMHIEDRIDEWRTGHDRGVSGASSRENKSDTDRAATAFEWAIRLRLHQIVEGYDALHGFVERAVTMILDSVQAIPYASRIEGCLLFPLVIAGSSSISVERRMMVKERLMVMESTLAFSHIHHARQLLETLWKGGNSASDLNWAAVRYSQFPGVVFI
ncbi:uncharacterized protein N7515_008919 [Penicillium bovifimosum]|uniref:Zn(2)-C6 fungal-type domain-containing protein n=1 Tax=Penicillium bovifimosum TaxID=126998 RepID=A0A9W9KWU2_9EURO|nr:uncharacterized protein N7515_008919 [Penicillium bovifimosum]KAJ5125094.1 hypothetical protein N7515_008919 [Penicillium bovifimosum]